MKLSTAFLLLAPAAAFTPGANFHAHTSPLNMATEAATESKAFAKLPASIKPGVVTGKALVDLLDHAKEVGFAIPGVNCVGSSSINSCMEAAKKYGGPIIVTLSKGGGFFIAGKAADDTDDKASIAGAVAAAKHVHEVAALYGVPVILHTDHCQKAWLPWMDGLVKANEEFYNDKGYPLFSSHMLDLSEEPLEENIGICKEYMEKFAKLDILLEFELGVTGGEEDGVDNTDIDNDRLYTQPEEVFYAYEQLSQVPNAAFTCAASFGNVHGVYAPGNVDLQPVILHNTQKYFKEKLDNGEDKTMKFVFHGGSGSSVEDIQYAIEAGVIKMNIDTDTQWAYWDGIRAYEAKFHDYLQGQIGSPDGDDKPNKKYYDPRMSLRAGEEAMAARLCKAAEDLKCVNVLN
jgi:fructose-bisphosphate aldolase class II